MQTHRQKIEYWLPGTWGMREWEWMTANRHEISFEAKENVLPSDLKVLKYLQYYFQQDMPQIVSGKISIHICT